MSLRLSVALTSSHPEVAPRVAAAQAIERARAANRAGLDGLFVGDHHATSTPYLQNVPFLGRLLAEWDDRPAGCLFLLPLWNPVLVAEQVATLATIAAGRFVLQTGLGGSERDSTAMGVDHRKRPSMFEEGLGIIRRLLAGETVDAVGRYSFRGARISPIPPEPVDVWVGDSATVGIERAARLGDGFLAAPYLRAEAADQAAQYVAACASVGREPGTVALRRDVYVAASQDEARTVREQTIATGYRGMPVDALAIGTVDQVAESFRAFGELGYTEIVVRHLVNDQRRVLDSYERLGEVRRLIRA